MLLPPGGRSAGRRRVAVAFTGLKACCGGLPKKARHLLVGCFGFPIEDQDRHINGAERLGGRHGGRRHRESPPQGPSDLRRRREPRLDWPRQGVRERLLPVPRDLGSTPTKSSRALDRIPIVINPFRFSLSAGKHRAGWFYWGVLVIAVDVPAI